MCYQLMCAKGILDPKKSLRWPPVQFRFFKYSTSLLYQMSLNQLKKVHELAFLQEHLLECGSQYYWKVKYLEIIFSEM